MEQLTWDPNKVPGTERKHMHFFINIASSVLFFCSSVLLFFDSFFDYFFSPPHPFHFSNSIEGLCASNDRYNRSVIIADTCSHCIREVSFEGQLLALWGERGSNEGQLQCMFRRNTHFDWLITIEFTEDFNVQCGL